MNLSRQQQSTRAFTLVEVVVSMAVCGIGLAGIVAGYTFATRQAEWAGYSQAAQSRAAQQLEKIVSAKWDTQAIPPVDELVATNFPGSAIPLDSVVAGITTRFCTNRVVISSISTNPPLKLIVVETTWSLLPGKVITNAVFTYRAPDQ